MNRNHLITLKNVDDEDEDDYPKSRRVIVYSKRNR